MNKLKASTILNFAIHNIYQMHTANPCNEAKQKEREREREICFMCHYPFPGKHNQTAKGQKTHQIVQDNTAYEENKRAYFQGHAIDIIYNNQIRT